MRYLFALAILLIAAVPVEAQDSNAPVGSKAWIKDKDFNAFARARVAVRICPDLGLDETLEAFGLSAHGLKSWTELPRSYVENALTGFRRDSEAACSFAYESYGPYATMSQYRLLRRVIRNPF